MVQDRNALAIVKKDIRKQQKSGAEEIVLTNPEKRKQSQKRRQSTTKKKTSTSNKPHPDRTSLNEKIVLQDPDKNVDHGFSRKQVEHSKTRFLFFSGVAIALSGIILFFINPYISFGLGMFGAIGIIIAIFVDF